MIKLCSFVVVHLTSQQEMACEDKGSFVFVGTCKLKLWCSEFGGLADSFVFVGTDKLKL